MGLFSKKYDIEKDRLLIKFCKERKMFQVYRDNSIIPYDSLNEKSRKKLDMENKVLIDNPAYLEHLLKGFEEKNRFQKLKSLGLSSGISFELLSANHGTMSEQLREYLNKVVNEPDVLIGIHRIKGSMPISIVEDILKNGLIMTGHTSAGAVVGGPSLAHNVSYYTNNSTIIKELMYANEFKDSHGSILIRIPDEDLKGEIFEKRDNGVYVLPIKYILGYIPVNKDHHIETIITSSYFNIEEKKDSSLNNEQSCKRI